MAYSTVFVLLAILGVSLGNPMIETDNQNLNSRIVGGFTAKEGQFPYQVALMDIFRGYFCSGSILNKNWILTAARCVNRREGSFFVVVGVTDLGNLIPSDSIYQVARVIVDSWNDSNPALIKTQDLITFSDNVNKINLPPTNMNVNDAPVVISGWGSLYEGGQPSKKLLYLHSKIFDEKSCKERMAQIQGYPPITELNLCTFTQGGEGLCEGDRGDPVVAGDYQVGIALYGYPCARGFPDISIDVWSYVDWIKSHIN